MNKTDMYVGGLVVALVLLSAFDTTSKPALYFGVFLLAALAFKIWDAKNAGTLTPFK